MAASKPIARCPHCGSTRLSLLDGHLVCTNCGAVLDDTVLYYGLSRRHHDEDWEAKKDVRKARANMRYAVLVGKAVEEQGENMVARLYSLGLSRDRLEALLEFMQSNDCVRAAIERIRDPETAALTLVMVYAHAIQGESYLPSTLVAARRVRRRVHHYYKQIVARCLGDTSN